MALLVMIPSALRDLIEYEPQRSSPLLFMHLCGRNSHRTVSRTEQCETRTLGRPAMTRKAMMESGMKVELLRDDVTVWFVFVARMPISQMLMGIYR
jgi:hypothetical protein